MRIAWILILLASLVAAPAHLQAQSGDGSSERLDRGKDARDESLRRAQPPQESGTEETRSKAPVVERFLLPPAGSTFSPPAPLPAMGFDSGGWVPEERLEFDCPEAQVCVVEGLDIYVAWMLAWQTTIPWQSIVRARSEHDSWASTLPALDVRGWELLAALGVDPRDVHPAELPSDARVEELAHAHLDGIRPPLVACRFPVVLEGVSAEQIDLVNGTSTSRLDSIDDDIARRIAEETGWCERDLLDARRFLGSWSRTARVLYLSPFLFEVSFGIELEFVVGRDGTRIARYPEEARIREVARTQRWPETFR